MKQESKEPMEAREIVGGFFPNMLENLRARTAVFEQVRRESESANEHCRECGEPLRWDVEETARRRVEGESATVFAPCSECRVREWMAARGVPTAYRHASFQNWRVECAQDGTAAEKTIAFTRNLGGVLIVSGAMGRGKTHLATAAFRAARIHRSIWTDQPSALTTLRTEYGSGNPASLAMRLGNAALLVWDDLGLSTGARDEGALVESVFYRRHANRLPTIITTNLAAREFAEFIGPRLAERMREQAFAWVALSGPSRRIVATPKTGA